MSTPDPTQAPDAPITRIYRTLPDAELAITTYLGAPRAALSGAALVAFHGGGWVEGSPQMWEKFGRALSRVGLTVFTPAYRLLGPAHPGRTLWDLVADAHAAFTWVHTHASEFDLDTARIGAGGGSAGGHLALSLALLPPKPPATAAPPPSFLLLGNPVTDTSPEGFGKHLLGDAWTGLSPLHALGSARLPPTLLFHGTADTTTPIAGARRFRDRAIACGATCELQEFPGRTHAFFNHEPDLSSVLQSMQTWIASHTTKSSCSQPAS
jgi:acetyl esterase/lipase